MKADILNIAKQLEQNNINEVEAKNLLLELFDNGFTLVADEEPPHDIELIVKAPNGNIHISSWRPAYNIFTCQSKSENSWNWSWKLIK
jgi:hypothetical protein